MAQQTAALNILIAESADAQAGLDASVAQTIELTPDVNLAVADTADLTAQLSSLIGPALLLDLDAGIADTVSLPTELDVILGPAAFASLEVRTAAQGLEVPAQLDATVAQTQTPTASLEALTAILRTFTACFDVPVAQTRSQSADLCINIECPGLSKLLTPSMSLWIAETRTGCSRPMDVLIDSGFGLSALLDLLIEGLQNSFVDLDVNIKSPDLAFGASAIYNADADEVQALMFVQDNGELHPEWIESMTATLLYRDEHDLGAIAFDCDYATGQGDVRVIWMHPAHITELSIRFVGVIDNCGDIDFTVSVGTEAAAQQQFSPQLLEGVDNVAPRTEYTPYGVTTHQLDAAPEEIDVISDEVVLTLLAIDLVSDNEPLVEGNGPIDYSGGGNRLLPALASDGSFVLQAANQLAHDIDGYTVIEPSGTNLLSNTNFATATSSTDAVPAGYEVTASSTITWLPTLVPTNDINSFRLRAFGSGSYVGPKTLTFSRTGTVALTPSAPVTWSCLARISNQLSGSAADIPTSIVKVDTLELVTSFRDAVDAEISQQIATFNPADITGDTFVLLQNATPVPPVGTVGVRVSLNLRSIEESDDINLHLMAPQVEESATATSRIVGSTSVSRSADTLRIPQSGNIEFRQGTVQIDFAANYPGTPPADSCLFDSRTAGFDGFALYHLANGKLRFIVAGPASDQQLETTATYGFNVGEAHSVSVSWGSSHRAIWIDGVEAITSTLPVTLPVQQGEWIWLFSTAQQTERFSGILTAVEIQREPQS